MLRFIFFPLSFCPKYHTLKISPWISYSFKEGCWRNNTFIFSYAIHWSILFWAVFWANPINFTWSEASRDNLVILRDNFSEAGLRVLVSQNQAMTYYILTIKRNNNLSKHFAHYLHDHCNPQIPITIGPWSPKTLHLGPNLIMHQG